jgi:serine/threonine protein kinase
MGLSIDSDKSHAYTVSEFVKGGSLFNYLHPGSKNDTQPNDTTGFRPLSEDKVFFFARQMANAMIYLHNQDI